MLSTLVHEIDIHKGLQSVLYNPTVVNVYGYEGIPCIQPLFTNVLLTSIQGVVFLMYIP